MNLFQRKIEPRCAYCAHGCPAADQKMVLCRNRGVVSPYFACRRFRYDPLMRVPHRQVLPHYDPKDFSLEDWPCPRAAGKESIVCPGFIPKIP